MVRIDINQPYEEFLKSQVEAGLFRSITAAAEDAIRKQMIEHENRRISSIHAAIAKGEADIQAGRTINYTPGLMSDISEKGKKAALERKPVKHEVKP